MVVKVFSFQGSPPYSKFEIRNYIGLILFFLLEDGGSDLYQKFCYVVVYLYQIW
jgi:hypothetical protein